MTEEITVTQELLYLEFALLSLENFIFDKDIEERINELYRLVQDRLYGFSEYKDLDFDHIEYKIVYFYK